MEEIEPRSVMLTKADVKRIKKEFSVAEKTDQISLILHLALFQVTRVHDSIVHAQVRAVRATLLVFRIAFAIDGTDVRKPNFAALLRICAHAKKRSRAKHIKIMDQMISCLANDDPEKALDIYFDGSRLVDVLPIGKIWETIADRKIVGDESSIAPDKRGLFVLSMSSLLLARNSPWRFWVDWLRSFNNERHISSEIRAKIIALDDIFWDSGQEAVADEIARIEAEFLAEKSPQAERVELNTESGKFFTVPIETTKPDLLGATMSQVQDALEDVLSSPSNGLHERSRETRVLRRVFERYGNDPQQIEMGFVSVRKGLTRQIVVAEELPASEENLALMDALDEGARAIRATHPEVDKNRKIINQQAIKELPDGAKETLEEALPMLVAISEEDLADDWRTDIPQLINDATEPLPNGAPPLPGVDETMRIGSRAAKISIWMKTADVVHKIDGSAGYKAARIVTTLAAIVTIFITVLT